MGKMKLLSAFWIVYWVFTLPSYSQNSFGSVIGRVVDNDEPVIFANVVVLHSDSTFREGTITDAEGAFCFEHIETGKNFIQLSFVGYDTRIIEIDVRPGKNHIGIVKMEPTGIELGEVTITATRPVFKMENGNLVTMVSNSLLSSLGTASDILERIPGINYKDDIIQVFGKGTPVIYVNNRKLQSITELEQIPSEDIQSVELIKNPGARYSASDRAVILVKTKKKESGFSALLFDRLRVAKLTSNAELLSLSYNKGNISWAGSYSHNYFHSINKENNDYTIYKDTVWNHQNDTEYRYKTIGHWVTTSLDWSVSPEHAIGIQYNGAFTQDKLVSDDDEIITGNGAIYESVLSHSIKRNRPETHIVNLFYAGNISDKVDLRTDFDIVKKTMDSYQVVDEVSQFYDSRRVNVDSYSDYKLFAGKLVGSYRLSNRTQMEAGMEGSRITGNGYYLNDQAKVHNNIYENIEDKFAGFIGFNSSWEDMTVGVGVRYEYSHEKQMEDSVKSVKVDKKYNNFYPNVSLTRDFGSLQMSLNFNGRTRRPSFAELNNDDLYVNQFLTQKGNPYLKKEDYYEVSYNLFYKFLNFSAGYTYVKNPISFTVEGLPGSSLNSILTYKNYSNNQKIDVSTTLDFIIGLWKPQLNVSLTQPFFSAPFRNETLKRNKTYYEIEFNNDFNLPKDYILSVYFNYCGDQDDRVGIFRKYKELDLNFRKSFLNKSLTLGLYISDVFNWRKMKDGIYINDFEMNTTRIRETRYGQFTIRYQFNNYKSKYRGKQASEDINRL